MTVNPVFHLHLPLYPAFPTLGIISATTVTFASFRVNSLGKGRYVCIHTSMSRHVILTSTKVYIVTILKREYHLSNAYPVHVYLISVLVILKLVKIGSLY